MAATALQLVKILVIALAGLLLGLALLLVAANHPQGRHLIAQKAAQLSHNTVVLTGLSGPFPQHLALEQLVLADADGVWLHAKQVRLEWDVLALLGGEIRFKRFTAQHLTVVRPPLPVDPPPQLPLPTAIEHLQVERLDLAVAVAGQAVSLAVTGSGQFVALNQAQASVVLQPLTRVDDTYRLDATITPGFVSIQANITEAASGLLGGLLHRQQPHAISLEARLHGPMPAVSTQVRLHVGPLTAHAEGVLDFIDANTRLTLAAESPAMPLLTGLSWQKARLSAQLFGQLNRPGITGTLDLERLQAAGAEASSVQLTARSDPAGSHVTGTLTGLKFAQWPADLLQHQPIQLAVNAYPDQPNRPLDFSVRHPLFHALGDIFTNGTARTRLKLTLTDLKPFADLAGLALQGHAEWAINSQAHGTATDLDGSGTVTLTGGDAKILNVLGKQNQLSFQFRRDGDVAELRHFDLKSPGLTAHAQGKADTQTLTGEYRLTLADLTPLAQGLTGQLSVQGQLAGQPKNFTLSADLSGMLGFTAHGLRHPNQPLAGKLRVSNLPDTPSGALDGTLRLAGAALNVSATAQPQPDGLAISLEQARWRSAHLHGQLLFPKNTDFPAGQLLFEVNRLADLQPLLGQTFAGSLNGVATTSKDRGRPRLTLQAQALQLQTPDQQTISKISLTATVDDLLRRPHLDARLSADGIATAALGGTLQLHGTGSLSALDLNLDAALIDQAQHPLTLSARAQANTQTRHLQVTQARLNWRKETLSLREPTRIGFVDDGLVLDNLRLGLRQATLNMSGRIGPTLDITAQLQNLPADLMALATPLGFALSGHVNAKARLTGPRHRPTGSLEAKAVDIKLQHQHVSLPPAQLTATAQLDGSRITLDGGAKIHNQAVASLNGYIPFDPNDTLLLNANADLDLKLSDPLLTAAGRRLRGRAKLLATVTGTTAQPRYHASLKLDKAEARDQNLGINITDIDALLKAENGLITLDRFVGKAGQGPINAQGSVNLGVAERPVAIKVSSRNARILASDRLTVNLDSDLTLKGDAGGPLLILGSILINRAEIRVPERLPAHIAVLRMQPTKTAPMPAQPVRKTDLGLNLVISAPDSIFVRGRGVDAELYGTVRLTGSASQPQPDGGFRLRRGRFTLAGKALTFSAGSVNFDGGSLTNPALDFTANATSNYIQASLNLRGTANKPILSLSSIPALPQDEVLARLLFDRGSADLSVTEMVQIGTALAALTGIDSGLTDPLEAVRTRLGLDRLTVGQAIEAGRYITPGIYVGARQALAGANPQATLQIDLTRQLKLEATLGGAGATQNLTLPNTNSIGILYQYEY